MASGVDGQRVSVITASPMREIGWGGLTVPVSVALAHTATRLVEGQQVATVSLSGATTVSSRVVAARSLPAPSLGWRLRHMF